MSRGVDSFSGPRCLVCGGTEYSFVKVLWPQLVEEWQLSNEEVDYVNRQQGEKCVSCQSSLRSIALADAITSALKFDGLLSDLSFDSQYEKIKVLELNLAGELTPHLQRLRGHQLVCYPEADIMDLPFDDDSFDLVVHSDTLEHVSDPLAGLSECRRVVSSGGHCCMTVPIILGRLTRSREALAPSYHGEPDKNRPDYRVFSEFGADVWKLAFEAGFSSVSFHSFEFPAGLSLALKKRR